jgi:hypothetical protein
MASDTAFSIPCPSDPTTAAQCANRHPPTGNELPNVERNLCGQKSSLSSFARSAHAFKQSRKSSFGLQPAVGNTRPHVLSAFAFHVFNFLTSFFGIGISRSLYALGVQFLSGQCGDSRHHRRQKTTASAQLGATHPNCWNASQLAVALPRRARRGRSSHPGHLSQRERLSQS